MIPSAPDCNPEATSSEVSSFRLRLTKASVGIFLSGIIIVSFVAWKASPASAKYVAALFQVATLLTAVLGGPSRIGKVMIVLVLASMLGVILASRWMAS